MILTDGSSFAFDLLEFLPANKATRLQHLICERSLSTALV